MVMPFCLSIAVSDVVAVVTGDASFAMLAIAVAPAVLVSLLSLTMMSMTVTTTMVVTSVTGHFQKHQYCCCA